MAVVNGELISKAESAAYEALRPWLELGEFRQAAAYCVDEGNMISDQPEALLTKFFLCLWFMENHKLHDFATGSTVRDLVRSCESLLLMCKIRPVSSPHSSLYGRLYRSYSQWTLESGDPWAAMWQSNLGQTLSNPGTVSNAVIEALFAADRALRLGHIASAAATYAHAEANARDLDERCEARLGLVICYRLLGELDVAESLAATTVAENNGLTSELLDFQWQINLCEAIRSKSIEPLLESQQNRSPFHKPQYAIPTSLLAYAFKNTKNQRQVKKSSTLRSHFDNVDRGTYEYNLIKCLQSLEQCYNEDLDLTQRLKQLGEVLALARQQLLIEDTLIFFAGAIRWLQISKQQPFLGYLVNEYQGLCLRISEGQSKDIWGFNADLGDTGELIDRRRSQETLSALPLTSTKLILKFSGLAAKASVRRIKDGVNLKRKGQTEEDSQRLLTEIVELVVQELGTFKGPVLKVGQLLAGMSALPPAARLRIQEALATTRHLKKEVFFDLFKAECGKSIDRIFSDIEPTPIGVGSMGQVFKAKLQDGTPVAIKIHYPDLEKNVDAFGRIYKLVGRIISHQFPRHDGPAIQNLILRIILDECDMHKEAATHQLMYDRFHGVGNIIIPKVFHQYTTKSVLVTEFMSGLKFFEFVPHASQEERQKFSQVVDNITRDAIQDLNLLQFDPHGGNYLYQNGKVVCLDFGSMSKISPQVAVTVMGIVKAIKSRDEKALYLVLTEAGAIDPAYITEATFCSAIAPFLMQKKSKQYDSKRHAITEIYREIGEKDLRHGLTVPPELLVCFFAFNFLSIIRENLNLSAPDTLPSDDLQKAS